MCGLFPRALFALVLLVLVGMAKAGTPQRIVFDVEHMTCPACGITIKAALKKEAGVSATQVDAKAATVTVDIDAELTSADRIARIISEAGFPAKARPDER